MMQMTVAYLFAMIMIVGLFVLAKRNQKQGWKKHRHTFEASEQEIPPVEHFSDLMRLNRSLSAYGQAVQPAMSAVAVKTSRKERVLG